MYCFLGSLLWQNSLGANFFLKKKQPVITSNCYKYYTYHNYYNYFKYYNY